MGVNMKPVVDIHKLPCQQASQSPSSNLYLLCNQQTSTEYCTNWLFYFWSFPSLELVHNMIFDFILQRHQTEESYNFWCFIWKTCLLHVFIECYCTSIIFQIASRRIIFQWPGPWILAFHSLEAKGKCACITPIHPMDILVFTVRVIYYRGIFKFIPNKSGVRFRLDFLWTLI